MRQLFGTDGMRGVAGEPPLDTRTTFAAGVALGRWIGSNHLDPEVVIGMDTRESGTWIAEYVAGGLASTGARARFAGLITTPGVAHVTRTGPFAAGVMISASHNPYQDNGVKILGHSGFKLPDEQEHALELDMFAWLESGAAPVRKPLEVDEGLDRAYVDHLGSTLPLGLAGIELVVDTANGAATYLAPALFERLGAKVDCIGCAPDGRNINLNCGSLHLESLRERVLATRASLGVAFDGDADRALFVSHSGKIVDGDAVMLLCALPLHRSGHLTVVRQGTTAGGGIRTRSQARDRRSGGKISNRVAQLTGQREVLVLVDRPGLFDALPGREGGDHRFDDLLGSRRAGDDPDGAR